MRKQQKQNDGEREQQKVLNEIYETYVTTSFFFLISDIALLVQL